MVKENTLTITHNMKATSYNWWWRTLKKNILTTSLHIIIHGWVLWVTLLFLDDRLLMAELSHRQYW